MSIVLRLDVPVFERMTQVAITRQHHRDLVERGFQAVQGGVASSTERGAAGLTNAGGEPRRQAEQSSGVRGFSRRGSELRLAAPFGEEGR